MDKHKLTIRKEEEPPVMPHQHHGLVQGWQQGTHKRVDEGQVYIFHHCPEKEAEAEEDHLIMMKYNNIWI